MKVFSFHKFDNINIDPISKKYFLSVSNVNLYHDLFFESINKIRLKRKLDSEQRSKSLLQKIL